MLPPAELAATLLPIAAVHWLNLVLPGPNVLLIARLAASAQRWAALAVGLGMSALVLVWATLASRGLALAMGSTGAAQTSLQLAGGAWLCLLALRLWQPDTANATTETASATTASIQPGADLPAGPEVGTGPSPGPRSAATWGARQQLGLGRAFCLGVITSAANPASSLFYLVLFAGITPSGSDDSLGMLVAALLFGNSLIWYSVVALALSRPGVCARYLRHRILLSRACSTLIGLMGARLLLLALPVP